MRYKIILHTRQIIDLIMLSLIKFAV